MQRLYTAFLTACMCLLLSSCVAAARYSNRNTLRIGWNGDVDTLNPFMATESQSYEAFRLIYDLLIGFGKNLEPVPDLARSWESSHDGLKWTYHLAHNARWQDGQPVTSADVKFTYEYIIRNKMDLFILYVAAINKIDTPDPYTVVFTCKTPSVLMEQIFVPILPKHIWEKVDPKTALTREDDHPIGSGPFRLAEWQKNRYMKFTANESYFRGRPHIDDVVFVAFANTNTMMQALRLGEIQAVSGIPPPLFRLLKQEPGIKTIVKPSNGFSQLTLNVWSSPKSKGNPLLRDVRVRQAMVYGIDKRRLLDISKLGYGDIGSTIIPKMFPFWHWEPAGKERMDYNPQKARQILEDAGYHVGPDSIRVDKKGRPLRFRLYARSGASEDLATSQLILEQLKEVGIAIDLRTVEKATQDNYIKDNADFDLAIYSWGGDSDPNFLLSLFTTKQIKNWNDYYYSNPAYDKLFEQQQHLINRNERRKVLQQMQRIIYHDAPSIVLYYDSTLQGFRTDKFAGWRDDQVEGAIMALGGLTYRSIYPVERKP